MLKKPSNTIPVTVEENQVIWNSTKCPIVLKLNAGTPNESLTFFLKKYVPVVQELLDNDLPLTKEFTVVNMDTNLSKEFTPLYLMKVVKKGNRIVGFLDIPLSWLLNYTIICSKNLDTDELTQTLNPTHEELMNLIPEVEPRVILQKKTNSEELDEIEEEENTKELEEELEEPIQVKQIKVNPSKANKKITSSKNKTPSKPLKKTNKNTTSSQTQKKTKHKKTNPTKSCQKPQQLLKKNQKQKLLKKVSRK